MRQKDINQIVEVKSRLEFNSRGNIIDRLNNVEKIFQQKLNLEGELDKELIKYVPIATIACFEAFFRSWCSNLCAYRRRWHDVAMGRTTRAVQHTHLHHRALTFAVVARVLL